MVVLPPSSRLKRRARRGLCPGLYRVRPLVIGLAAVGRGSCAPEAAQRLRRRPTVASEIADRTQSDCSLRQLTAAHRIRSRLVTRQVRRWRTP